MTPVQIARQEDTRKTREFFHPPPPPSRTARILHRLSVLLPQMCFWGVVLFGIGYATWSAVSDLGNGIIR